MDQDKKQCEHCKTFIPKDATKCPQCHTDLRSWAKRHPIWTVLLVLIGGPILFFQIQSDLDTSPQSATEKIVEIKTTSARILSKSYIERVPLKSPSTAKYNPPTTKQDPKNPNLFEVSSYIDSQNGFGATVRTYWSMKWEYIGSADTKESIETDANWKMKEFIFDGENIK